MRHIFFRDFSMMRAAFLSAAMICAHVSAPGVQATQHVPASDWIIQQFSNHVFRGQSGVIDVTARFLEDGTVVIDGPLGSFAGRWQAIAGKMCLSFDMGPRKGPACRAVSVVSAQHLVTDHGVTLTRIASARRL